LYALFRGDGKKPLDWSTKVYPKAYINCACGTEKLEVEAWADDLMWVGLWYMGGWNPCGFFGRLKGAYRVLRGEGFLHDDMVLDAVEAAKLAEYITNWIALGGLDIAEYQRRAAAAERVKSREDDIDARFLLKAFEAKKAEKKLDKP
jgi:hypothetical protein